MGTMKGGNGVVSKSTTLATVDERKRNAAGQLLPGQKSLNPGGLNADERAARDAIRAVLATPEMREAGLAAYKRCLAADNPVIVKDYMDRVAGKVKEHIEVNGGDGNPLSHVLGVATLAELLELVRSGK
jgi:hypothetical protein